MNLSEDVVDTEAVDVEVHIANLFLRLIFHPL